MDEKIEAFREEVLRWRGTRRKGARPYTTEMKAKALQLAKDLQEQSRSKRTGWPVVGWRKPNTSACRTRRGGSCPARSP
jgi:hypothetical protein